MLFYYGVAGYYNNVTSSVKAQCAKNGTITLPASDVTRAALLGDTVPRVVKEIIIVDSAGDTLTVHAHSQANIPEGATSVSQVQVFDKNAERAEWFKRVGSNLGKPTEILEGLHARSTLMFGDYKDELPEQLLSLRFIHANDVVLEIGGNIGRNSCTIAQILEDDSNLVVMESSPTYAYQCAVNRNLNGFKFHIESSALSRRPLTQSYWTTSSTDRTGTPVNTITLDDLRARYPLNFTVLVADCEGALVQILEDFPDLLTGINKVLLENDFKTLREKEFVDNAFREAGLVRAVAAPGPENPPYPFPCLDRFYEAWVRP